LHLYDGFNCDICKNKGIIFKGKEMEIVTSDCICLKSRKSIRLLKASGLENVINDFQVPFYTLIQGFIISIL
jgi:hypothetical protein